MEKQLHLLTGSYALNALPDGEREEFERYAMTDPQTQDEVRSLGETAALLSLGTTEETPPPELKSSLMAAIRNTRQLPVSEVVRDISSAPSQASARVSSTTSRNRRAPLLSVAAAMVIVAGIGGWAIGQSAMQQDMAQKLSALQAQQQALELAQQQAQEKQSAVMGIVAANDAKIATTKLSDGVSVTVASSATANQAAVMTRGMPALPAEKTYELWFISADGAVPAGLMAVTDPSAPALQILDAPMDGATHVGITVEPAGGSPAPTSAPLVVQAL